MIKDKFMRALPVPAIAGSLLAVMAAFNPAAAEDSAPAGPSERVIYLTGSIVVGDGEAVIKKMNALDKEDPTKPITLQLSSGGGSLVAALAIYDHAQMIKAPIKTVCAGQAASAAWFLLSAAGAPGMREAYPNCRIMAHELANDSSANKVVEIKDKSDELRAQQDNYYSIVSQHTGWSVEALQQLTERRDFSMTAEEAKEMNFVDKVTEPLKPQQEAERRDRFPDFVCKKLKSPRPFCP